MIRHIFSYLLTLLIALQSVAAMADIHQLSHADHKTATFEKSVSIEVLASDETDSYSSDTQSNERSDGNTVDCHLCCHCHDMTHFLPAGSHRVVVAIQTHQVNSAYQTRFFSHRSSPDIPPPII